MPSTQVARRLKAATDELVDDLGKIENAAADIGKGKSTVHRWTDPNDADHFINVRDLATLERRASRPFVTEQLCRIAGGVFVPMPDVAADPGTLAGRILQITVRLGALSQCMAEALADDHVDPNEARQMLDLQAELAAVNAQLRLALEEIARGGDAAPAERAKGAMAEGQG